MAQTDRWPQPGLLEIKAGAVQEDQGLGYSGSGDNVDVDRTHGAG